MAFVVSANDVRQMGLQIAKLSLEEQQSKGANACADLFQALYGSTPEVVQKIWEDLCTHSIVSQGESNFRGFKKLLLALYELWTYPKNARLMANKRPAIVGLGAKDSSLAAAQNSVAGLL